ncbi:MAG TPA: sigma-70 family RNA polymerase sigma factor [Terriglobales bacterium]|jgi:RNA polymerase sigma-70 factor (ECF subfamily)
MRKHVGQNSAQIEVSDSPGSDLALVHASKQGDVAAFGELVKRYDRKLFRIAHHLTQNAEDAEDAVQDAFLKAFQHLQQFREDSKFSTWLIRIVLNLALMKLRKRRLAKEFSLDSNSNPEDDDHLPIDVADWAPNPEQLYRAAELQEILRRALQKLSPGLRMVFVLRDIEGLSLEQTAEALGLSVAAVKARTWRARLQLRQRLSKYFHRAAPVKPRSSPVAVSALPAGT